MLRKMIYILSLLFILAACSSNSNDSKTETEELITPVEVAEVSKGNLTLTHTFYGKISAEHLTPLIPPSSGQIMDLEVANGEEVEEGDAIAYLSPGYIPIEAPHDGVVEQLTVKEGSIVTNTNPIGTVVSLHPLKVTFHATEKQRSLFGTGESVKITINEQDAEATIDYISHMPDDTGLYIIEATLDNADEKFFIGMIAVAQIPEETIENELIVPTQAIIQENEEHFVYVVKENIARKVPVEILATQTENSAIKGDISVGSEIVTKGMLTLTDGSKVEVMGRDE
jgi:membrane fusion protein, multidrug efflux system